MATQHDEVEWEEYTEEELEIILREMEQMEKEKDAESDVEIDVAEGNDEEEESEEESDPEDNVPLADLQTTWRRAAVASRVNEFHLETGPSHALPANAKPFDYFFFISTGIFFSNVYKVDCVTVLVCSAFPVL